MSSANPSGGLYHTYMHGNHILIMWSKVIGQFVARAEIDHVYTAIMKGTVVQDMFTMAVELSLA